MKKIVILMSAILVFLLAFYPSIVQASDNISAEEILNSEPSSKLIEMTETQKEELEDYIEDYGSRAYGLTAFLLNKLRIFSIPFCFLGIVVSAIYQYVIGIRKLDVRYKGFYTMIAFITIFVICQILPLVFVIVIKGFERS